jgi:glycine/D-amino acid oxidase-like deaminating enzyme/nitrite reductase/ring-hydroxylating ferredoxin subunit
MNHLPSDDNTQSGKISAGKNISCWFEKDVHTHLFPELSSDEKADVVIIGAGLAGLTTAYCLVRSGKKVVVIDDGFIGSGETGRTTAQIVTALEDRYYHMEEIFGKEDSHLIAQSHKQAIDFIENVVKKEKIECDFKRVNGYLFLHESDKEENLIKELDALHRCNIEAYLLDEIPGISSKEKSILYPGQAQFQPLKYLLALCRIIEKEGSKIFVNTHAKEIDHTGIISDKGFSVKADHVVVATNAPVNDKWAMMLKQWAYRSYVIGATVKKGSLPESMWWDTGDQSQESSAYHYVRLHRYNNEYDLLISGGEDHIAGKSPLGSEEEHYRVLENWTRKKFPIIDVVSKWSGEVLVPMDTIAYIGRNRFDRDNVYIITGDSGIGMTYCTIGGILISDLINGVKNEWEEIYKPSRFTFSSSKPFFRMLKGDLVEVLKKWFYMDSVELSAIKENEAGIVKLDGKKCGAYRDENGRLFLVSAECTHLKCMVAWNKSEKSWDCPCHGSRFTYTGKVINGPANEDLPAFSDPDT